MNNIRINSTSAKILLSIIETTVWETDKFIAGMSKDKKKVTFLLNSVRRGLKNVITETPRETYFNSAIHTARLSNYHLLTNDRLWVLPIFFPLKFLKWIKFIDINKIPSEHILYFIYGLEELCYNKAKDNQKHTKFMNDLKTRFFEVTGKDYDNTHIGRLIW